MKTKRGVVGKEKERRITQAEMLPTTSTGWAALPWCFDELRTSGFVHLAVVDPVTILQFSPLTGALMAF